IAASQLAIRSIVKRGRGVPRITKNYLRRVRDRAISTDANIITASMVEETFKELGIDDEGFSEVEIKILKALYDTKIPIGLDNLSVIANESPKALQASSEPYLIRKGYIIRSGRGRLITDMGKKYLEETGYVGKKRTKVDIPTDYQRF
ncbi:MAG: Holliday junction DNA helicase RuvB C-terminal domain-containing protein, partial [Candidatus Bathyarchaeia archaeon]